MADANTSSPDRGPGWLAALRTVARAGVERVKDASTQILQRAVGVGLAWFIAHRLLGHAMPFFAPIAALISLGISLFNRRRRALELIFGVLLGFVIADSLVNVLGRGWWQLSLYVAVTMVVAAFLDKGLLFPTQAASSALLVVLMPASIAGPGRLVDALVGCVVGITIAAFLPAHPLSRASRACVAVLETAQAVLREVTEGLREGDEPRLEAALTAARATQPQIDLLHVQLEAGGEITQLSPVFWRRRDQLRALTEAAEHADRVIRDLRVLARRAWIISKRGDQVDPQLLGALSATAEATARVGAIWAGRFQDPELKEQAFAALRVSAALLGPAVLEDGPISTKVVLAQLESAIYDLFLVAGFDAQTAVSVLHAGQPT